MASKSKTQDDIDNWLKRGHTKQFIDSNKNDNSSQASGNRAGSYLRKNRRNHSKAEKKELSETPVNI